MIKHWKNRWIVAYWYVSKYTEVWYSISEECRKQTTVNVLALVGYRLKNLSKRLDSTKQKSLPQTLSECDSKLESAFCSIKRKSISSVSFRSVMASQTVTNSIVSKIPTDSSWAIDRSKQYFRTWSFKTEEGWRRTITRQPSILNDHPINIQNQRKLTASILYSYMRISIMAPPFIS